MAAMDFTTLFQGDVETLPPPWQQVLTQSSMEEKLHLFELMHPIHRLLDFWCMQPDDHPPRAPLKQWSLQDWQQANVQLHPQLKLPKIKQALVHCIRHQEAFEISRYLSVVRATPCVIKTQLRSLSVAPMGSASNLCRTGSALANCGTRGPHYPN